MVFQSVHNPSTNLKNIAKSQTVVPTCRQSFGSSPILCNLPKFQESTIFPQSFFFSPTLHFSQITNQTRYQPAKSSGNHTLFSNFAFSATSQTVCQLAKTSGVDYLLQSFHQLATFSQTHKLDSKWMRSPSFPNFHKLACGRALSCKGPG